MGITQQLVSKLVDAVVDKLDLRLDELVEEKLGQRNVDTRASAKRTQVKESNDGEFVRVGKNLIRKDHVRGHTPAQAKKGKNVPVSAKKVSTKVPSVISKIASAMDENGYANVVSVKPYNAHTWNITYTLGDGRTFVKGYAVGTNNDGKEYARCVARFEKKQ